MNLSNIVDKLINFQHYEYIAIPLIIFSLAMISLQQSGLVSSSIDPTIKQKNPFRLKIIDLGLIIILLLGFVLITFKKNPGMIDGRYLVIFSTILSSVRLIYKRVFEKNILIIKQQNDIDQQYRETFHKNRNRNITIYCIFLLFIIFGFTFFGAEKFSDPISTFGLILMGIILYVIGFIFVWNLK